MLLLLLRTRRGLLPLQLAAQQLQQLQQIVFPSPVEFAPVGMLPRSPAAAAAGAAAAASDDNAEGDEPPLRGAAADAAAAAVAAAAAAAAATANDASASVLLLQGPISDFFIRCR